MTAVVRRVLAGALALTAGLALAGCSDTQDASAGGKPEVEVSGAYMPQPVTDKMAAGFFTVTNSGGTDDKLTSVTSKIADKVTLHSTQGQTMREKDSFPLAAGATLDFERGGNHLMFETLNRKPKVGEKVSVELHFAKSGTVRAEFPVKETTYNPKADHDAHKKQ